MLKIKFLKRFKERKMKEDKEETVLSLSQAQTAKDQKGNQARTREVIIIGRKQKDQRNHLLFPPTLQNRND